MKVRIVNNNGKGHDTEVTDAETGEKIGDICAATIHCRSNEIVRAELTFNIPKIDILAIAALSETTKRELRNLRDLLQKIDGKEVA